jgi:predicted lipoprotein with Yx(FWY)xxD motif
MPTTRQAKRLLFPLLVTGAFALAACGSSAGSSGAGGGGSGTAAAATVSVHTTGKGQALTDANGRTLYVSDQEKGTVACKSSACTAIWLPLTVATGTKPTGPSSVSSRLGTLTRPDGKRQVTWHGQPLYEFSFDHAAGDTGGDGQKDSFDGTDFTWHVATPTGAPAAPSTSPPTYGGYPY